MSVCLIGGTGFLGRHLCQALHRAGTPAVTVSRAPDDGFLREYAPSIRACRVSSPDLDGVLRESSCIVYLASQSRPSPDWRRADGEIRTNVLETTELVQRALDANPTVRVIFASSGGTIYGPGATTPISEESPANPTTAYALGKFLTESTLKFLAGVEGAHLTLLRIANPVGIWQVGSSHGFVSLAVHAALTGREIVLFGEGRNQRDYIDADDLAELLMKIAVTTHEAGTYNVGSGRGVCELDIIRLVEQVTGRRVPFRQLPGRPFDLPYAVLDARKASRQLGWVARTGLEQIIEKLGASMS